jgi:Protein of unknown function (DUF2587)
MSEQATGRVTEKVTGQGGHGDGHTSAHGDGDHEVYVIGPDGQPVAVETDGNQREGDDTGTHITDLVEQPAKVMRIGSMIRQLLDEVKSAPLDEASRSRLKEIHRASIKELEAGLAPELIDELQRLSLPFTEEGVPSESELRIAQAQLVGWLEGLFHGIQTAIYAQQMAARAQLEQMRRSLPPGMTPSGGGAAAGFPGQAPGQARPDQPNEPGGPGGGMYL